MPPRRDPRIPDLISTSSAGDILGVTKRAAQDLYLRGQLPGAMVGRNIVFRPEAVREAAKSYAPRKTRKPTDDTCVPQRDPQIPDLITGTEAAKRMNVSREAVSKLYLHGRLAGAKAGHILVFRPEEIGDVEPASIGQGQR